MSILGWLMVAASLAATCYGMPRQIVASFRGKTAPAGLRAFVVLAFPAYLLRLAYTVSVKDWATAMATLPGVLASGVLLAQQFTYASGPPDAPGGIL